MTPQFIGMNLPWTFVTASGNIHINNGTRYHVWLAKDENEGGKINTNNNLLSRHQYLPAAQFHGSKLLQ